MALINDLVKARIQKLEELRKLGVNPYPSVVRREQTVDQARQMLNRSVAVVGRVMGIRSHGQIFFWDVSDESGKIQVVLKADLCQREAFRIIEFIDIGDFVAVQGYIGKTQAGELSIFAQDFQIITKTIRPLPDQWHGLKDIEERYRKRYLDTILNPVVKQRLVMRSKVVDSIRDFLTDRGFIEVETPTLQPVYGGGFARPFSTHHNVLDTDFYLRISDEMYLKRLIVGGFEKVFEITKVFRNEGVDHDHNPEFTMFEAQIAFKDYSYGMDIIEEIIEYCATDTLGKTKISYQGKEIDVKRPWKRYKLVEAVKEYTGIEPLDWKTIVEAKDAVKKLQINGEKLKSLTTMNSIGEVIAFVFEELVEGKLIQPTIIHDYPIEVSPLAKKCPDPRFTQRFEMFAFGSELGNNYTELNDPLDLRKRFVEEKKREKAGFEEAHQTDYEYLEAIEHGFPPTCGIAIGVDRLAMLFTDAKTIKEIIPFPTLRKKSDNTQKQKIIDTKKSEVGELGISYEQAKNLLGKYLKKPANQLHSQESEVIMRALARHFGEDKEKWGIIGLLHDLDWELTEDNPKQHCIKTAEILKTAGGTDFLIQTIQSHGYEQGWGNEYYGPDEFKGKKRAGRIQHALAAAETLTGLIIATALIQPDKKLTSVKLESLIKKFKSKSFAANCNREIILECEKIGLNLDEFLNIGLNALQEIHEEIGL